jgi:hypothetical protein
MKARTHRTLLEYTWNHTTLAAFKVDKGITYLQSAFIPGQHLEQVRRMDKLLSPGSADARRVHPQHRWR